jgi:hypothetical protein
LAAFSTIFSTVILDQQWDRFLGQLLVYQSGPQLA